MSKVCMTLAQSSGTWLKGCLQPQHYYVSLSIEDPDGSSLVRVALSYEQAARMLLYNGDVECTLNSYRNKEGDTVSEKVEPPPSVHKRMKERLGDTHKDLLNRLEDVRRDVYDMLNGVIKPGKKTFADLLNNIEVIQNHYKGNESFVVQQAEEELGEMQSNAAGQLGMFLQTRGLEVAQESLMKLIPVGVPEDQPKMLASPVSDGYALRKRPERALEGMTALEVADQMAEQLKRLERLCVKSDGHNNLYNSSAREKTGGKVEVTYISYQGTSVLELEKAKRYLVYLKSLTKIEDFKSHHWFENKDA